MTIAVRYDQLHGIVDVRTWGEAGRLGSEAGRIDEVSLKKGGLG
jgi:hypothetical protein